MVNPDYATKDMALIQVLAIKKKNWHLYAAYRYQLKELA